MKIGFYSNCPWSVISVMWIPLLQHTCKTHHLKTHGSFLIPVQSSWTLQFVKAKNKSMHKPHTTYTLTHVISFCSSLAVQFFIQLQFYAQWKKQEWVADCILPVHIMWRKLCMPVTKLVWMLSWKIKSVSFHLTDKIVHNSWWSRDAVEIAFKAAATET